MNNNIDTTFDSIKDTLSAPFTLTAEKTREATSQITEFIQYNNSSLFIGLIIVILICVVVAYVLYYLITTKLFLNVKQVADKTKVPVIGTSYNTYDFTIDKTGNGDRRTYSFWIYLHDMNRNKSNFKHVLSLNNGTDIDIRNASPLVFLDDNDNKLYVRLANIDKSNLDTQTPIKDLKQLADGAVLDNFMKQGIVIPYVPMQRWVHIAIVCNANSYKNYLYVYVDGDLVNTTSNGEVDRYITSTAARANKDYTKLDINVSGILRVGGDGNDYHGFSGLISKFTTFNYELNQKDIYGEYNEGPIGSMLAKLGLGLYGIQSPIYKIQ